MLVLGRRGKKITIELNFGENEMSAFQRKMTEFDTRSKKIDVFFGLSNCG